MANYNSDRTGLAHDNDEDRLAALESKVALLESTLNDINNIYLKKVDASSIYAPKTSVINSLYAITKSTDSGTAIAITVPGHANRAYDRIMIWAFGNMNGTPYYGIIRTVSSSDGSSPGATFTGSHSPTCTYTNSGSDRIINISGLPAWGTFTLLSLWEIR